LKRSPGRIPAVQDEELESAGTFTSEQDLAILRKTLKEIIDGPAFRGSHRSSQFLEFIVERSLAGELDQLKERLIGVQLFNRQPSYDTGEDAIVRVTASDVRRRLLQHYGWFGTSDEFRIDLPSGSYVPRISRKSHAAVAPDNHLPLASPLSPSWDAAREVHHETVVPPPIAAPPVAVAASKARSFWRTGAILALLLLAAFLGWWLRSPGRRVAPASAAPGLPWSALFDSSAAAHLITSDPNIDAVQGITKTDLSLSDYANHRYIPDPGQLTPEQIRLCELLLMAGDFSAAPDAPTAVKIAEIAEMYSKKLEVQPSRDFQLSFLSNNDNFIFLGSPRSNPWSSLFRGELDFQFVYDTRKGSEYILNAHPRPSEPAAYVPSANGGGTGYSFAIIAFVQNPDENGQILLLAGADGEGTAAAGDFVTDMPRISPALRNCGIPSSAGIHHFEILLRTETMAGVPRETHVVACHLLP
jgi:hypothetical protein